MSGCALQAFIRGTAFSLPQIQQFKVNCMANQDQKWSPQVSIWVSDVQFSVYSDSAEEWKYFSIEKKKKKSPRGLDCKMTHECLLNGGTWNKKTTETFLCIKYWRIWLAAVMVGRKTQQMSTATLDVLRGNKTDCMKLAGRYCTSTEKGKSSWLFEPSYSYPFIFLQLFFWKAVIKVIKIKFYLLNERT